MDRKLTSIEIKDGLKNIWYWQNNGDSFHCKLFSLIAKADIHNKKLLAMGFPVYVEIYRMWDEAKDQDVLFQSYGLPSLENHKMTTGR